MGHGVDLQRQDIALAGDADGIIEFLHIHTGTAELCRDRLQMLGGDIFDQNVAAGGSSGNHVAARLDLVRDDAVGAAVHLFHAAHLDHIGAGTAHIRAAHIQEVCQINNMGLLGAVFQNGLALCHHSGEHTVHGSAHADLIKEAVLCTQCAEHLEVLVDGAGAQIAAAGHGHLCLAKAGEQCTQEVVAGTHLAGQIVRDVGAVQVGGVDLVGIAVQHLDAGTQGAQDLQADCHITDVRQVFDHTDICRQNGGRQNAHSRIFCTGNGNFAMQGLAARNNKLFQFYNLLVAGPPAAGPLRVLA